MASKVQDIITEQIVTWCEEEGDVPWNRPWNIDSQKNLNSKRKYEGILNRLLLEMYQMAGGYESNYWMTYKGAKSLGGNVKKGEKSHIITFYKMLEVDDEQAEGGKKNIPLLRFYKVFNLDQTEDIEAPKTEELDFKSDEKAEEIIANMPEPPSVGFGGPRACYEPKKDHVQMPLKKKAKSEDGWYCTMFHELVHSTGHEKRLNRPEIAEKIIWADEDYSKEELCAEIGAAILGSHCNFDPSNVERSGAYVKSWLRKLRDDTSLIFQAAKLSGKATEYILNEDAE